MKYLDEIKKAMSFLAEHPKTYFIGQAVEYEGTGLYESLKHLPSNKRLELPVAEHLQSGLTNGMGIEGMIPISTFPRWNFLLMGVDQIVNHLDKFKSMSNGDLTPRGMEDLVLWCEEDMRDRKLNQASEIENFEELN